MIPHPLDHKRKLRGKTRKKKEEVWASGIDLGSPSRKCKPKKLNMRLIVAQGIRNWISFLDFVLIHKSYVSKYFMNVAYRNRTRDLGILTTCISLVPYNLG